MTTAFIPRALALGACLTLMNLGSGCALLRKGEPLAVRYFSAEASPAPSNASRATVSLRLGKVQAASHVRERIVYRKDQVEVGYYDQLRWTEPPEHYLERMLSTMLFEQGRFARIVSGPGPTLDATLLTLEEVQGSPHLARAVVSLSLYDDRTSLVEQTFQVDVEIASEGEPEAKLAKALASALSRVAQQVVARSEQAFVTSAAKAEVVD